MSVSKMNTPITLPASGAPLVQETMTGVIDKVLAAPTDLDNRIALLALSRFEAKQPTLASATSWECVKRGSLADRTEYLYINREAYRNLRAKLTQGDLEGARSLLASIKPMPKSEAGFWSNVGRWIAHAFGQARFLSVGKARELSLGLLSTEGVDAFWKNNTRSVVANLQIINQLLSQASGAGGPSLCQIAERLKPGLLEQLSRLNSTLQQNGIAGPDRVKLAEAALDLRSAVPTLLAILQAKEADPKWKKAIEASSHPLQEPIQLTEEGSAEDKPTESPRAFAPASQEVQSAPLPSPSASEPAQAPSVEREEPAPAPMPSLPAAELNRIRRERIQGKQEQQQRDRLEAGRQRDEQRAAERSAVVEQEQNQRRLAAEQSRQEHLSSLASQRQQDQEESGRVQDRLTQQAKALLQKTDLEPLDQDFLAKMLSANREASRLAVLKPEFSALQGALENFRALQAKLHNQERLHLLTQLEQADSQKARALLPQALAGIREDTLLLSELQTNQELTHFPRGQALQAFLKARIDQLQQQCDRLNINLAANQQRVQIEETYRAINRGLRNASLDQLLSQKAELQELLASAGQIEGLEATQREDLQRSIREVLGDLEKRESRLTPPPSRPPSSPPTPTSAPAVAETVSATQSSLGARDQALEANTNTLLRLQTLHAELREEYSLLQQMVTQALSLPKAGPRSTAIGVQKKAVQELIGKIQAASQELNTLLGKVLESELERPALRTQSDLATLLGEVDTLLARLPNPS